MLSKALAKRIEKASAKVEYGDLYRALHQVGDDLTKADIEETLKDMLPEETFKRVVAVFKLAVED